MLSFTSCTDDGYFFSADAEEIVVHLNAPHTATVHGGVPPYRWEITGNAFKVRSWRTTLGDNKISVTTHYVAGESVEELTVTDRCGSEVSIMIVGCIRESCCDASDYASPTLTLDDYEDGDTSVTCRIANGCPPFHWAAADPLVGLINRFTNLRENTLTRAGGFYVDPVIYISDTCGNVCGNGDDYSFYFPFATSYDDIVGRSEQTVFGTAPVPSSAYTSFPASPCMVQLADSVYFTPTQPEPAHLHIEFYSQGSIPSWSMSHIIYRQYTSAGEVKLVVAWENTSLMHRSYVQFSASGTYPALSLSTAGGYDSYSWQLNTWHEIDITVTWTQDPVNPAVYHNLYSLYIDKVVVDTAEDRVWADLAAPVQIGNYGEYTSSVLRLRNCFFIKGAILL